MKAYKLLPVTVFLLAACGGGEPADTDQPEATQEKRQAPPRQRLDVGIGRVCELAGQQPRCAISEWRNRLAGRDWRRRGADLDVAGDFAELAGRGYGYFEPYKMDDAEVAILVLGSTAGTVRAGGNRDRRAFEYSSLR